jgi:hypothetical protein
MSQAIIWPMVAMVAITFVAWTVMFIRRIGYMQANRLDPQSAPVRAARTGYGEPAEQASDNWTNLFEAPVLFYALCLALFATNLASDNMVIAAWVYVALRAVHTAIHLTYNKVMHRFAAYAISSLLLFGLWAWFAVGLASSNAVATETVILNEETVR